MRLIMCNSKKRYSDSDRLCLSRQYLESGLSKREFCRQHGISNASLLTSWIERYSCEIKSLSLPLEDQIDFMAQMSKSEYREEISRLRAEVAGLRKALEFSRLETQARDMLIEKAEETFSIPIRKKTGAK